MSKLMLACCKVYISESRNKVSMSSIEQAAKQFPRAAIINKFEDDTYNRVGYSLVSELPSEPCTDLLPLKNAVFSMVKSAFKSIDFELHSGSHPRLGVVDHICFHPLGSTSLYQTSEIARSLASDIGSILQVPTFLYGGAHKEGRSLDSIRRELGYFKPNSSGTQWAGGGTISDTLALVPDKGPPQVDRTKGVVVIGSVPWIDNYNIPVFSADVSAIRRVAKRISERGGGLPSVQAMALVHGQDIIEVACNLLDPSTVGGELVQFEVERLVREEDLNMAVGKGYYTDMSQEAIIESYSKLKLNP